VGVQSGKDFNRLKNKKDTIDSGGTLLKHGLYRWVSIDCWHLNKVAFLCAKKRKPFTVAEELVKPCALH